MKNPRFSLMRGFTLIELLVVISIIGMLSSVILVALSGARDKAVNSNIRSNLVSIRTQAELYLGTAGSYASVCADPRVAQLISSNNSLGGTGSSACSDVSTGWAAASKLKIAESGGIQYWCIDNAGANRGVTSGAIAYTSLSGTSGTSALNASACR